MAKTKLPEIGQRVRIQTKPMFHWQKFPPKPIEGVVAVSESWDQPGTIRLSPANTPMNTSIISLKNILSITVIRQHPDSEVTEFALEGASTGVFDTNHLKSRDEETERFEVVGSKGDIYTVTKYKETFKCTCIAGQMNRQCKHVKEIKDKFG